MDKIAYTIPEAVEATGISRTMIYKAMEEGRLTAKKNGKRTLILREELERFMRALPAL